VIFETFHQRRLLLRRLLAPRPVGSTRPKTRVWRSTIPFLNPITDPFSSPLGGGFFIIDPIFGLYDSSKTEIITGYFFFDQKKNLIRHVEYLSKQ
jgi:hypothetical protein